MLPLIACNNIDGLLNKVEIVLLIASCRAEIEVPINESLRASIEQRIDIGLVPAALLNRLKLTVKII